MGFTHGKDHLMEDLQLIFAKHNVESISVKEPGTLFKVEADGGLHIGTGATIKAFDRQPNDKNHRFQSVKGGKS